MTRNTVLTDKSGNPLAPATTAEQVAYDNEKNVKQVIDDKATKQEVDVERKRIDTFTSLPDGATTGDAELADIRVAADGKKYNTAGEAVRAQANAAVKTQQGIRYAGKCLTVGSDGNLYPSITPPAIYLPAKGEFITTTDSTAYPLGDIKLYGRSIQDGEPSPDTPIPIVSVGEYNEETEKYEVGIAVTGAQLFDASKIPTKSQYGATVTNNGDGSFTVSGNGAMSENYINSYYCTHEETVNMIRPGNIFINGVTETNPYFYIQLKSKPDTNASSILLALTNGTEIPRSILENPKCILQIIFIGKNGSKIVPGTVKPMVYQSGDGTWEPFKQQLSTLQIPNPLRGIPVDSGGNYTDADGQQWICDYIDRERGKYVQILQSPNFVGSPNFAKSSYELGEFVWDGAFDKASKNSGYRSMSSFAEYANFKKPGCFAVTVNVLYYTPKEEMTVAEVNELFRSMIDSRSVYIISQLLEPIETDLTPDQLAALNLSTYEGVTNIGTDSNAGIEIRYGVDTQTYINNKIAELTENLSLMQSTVPEET